MLALVTLKIFGLFLAGKNGYEGQYYTIFFYFFYYFELSLSQLNILSDCRSFQWKQALSFEVLLNGYFLS